ncbi:MAG: S1C family serine protease [Oscillospiraceae bacterium]|nr:S1C family serine protease [Oscillospiraceae bacterium]
MNPEENKDVHTVDEPIISEPAVSAPPYETYYSQNYMYSPGIYASRPPYPRKRTPENGAAKPAGKRGFNIGGFIRAACLVLICTILSASATYLVMDYRFKRGDFTINRNVVLGSDASPSDPAPGDFTTPLVTQPDGMLPQDIYDMALTQVVGINTVSSGSLGIFGNFGGATPISGTGFIISTDGYILTNYHVIESAHESNGTINVVLRDDSKYEATVVGFDAYSDVAVLKIEAEGLNPVKFGNSDTIRVGQTVYAVGNPFGDFVYTMTDGIISALDRIVTVEDGKPISTFQFSAAVNSGNSGGPIYNTNGEVIGIVTAKVIRGNVEGIGFAILINDAVFIATELIEHGYISGRPLLGVTVQNVSPAHADYFGWVVGTYVRSVTQGSAADKAGVQVGDIIIAIADNDIDSLVTLRYALRAFRAGDTVPLTVWRNGDTLELSITFDEDPHAGRPQKPDVPEPDSPNPFDNIP